MFFPTMPPSIFATPHHQQSTVPTNSTWPSGYRTDGGPPGLFFSGYPQQPVGQSTSTSSTAQDSSSAAPQGMLDPQHTTQTLSQLLFLTQMLYHQQQSLQAQVQQLCLLVQQMQPPPPHLSPYSMQPPPPPSQATTQSSQRTSGETPRNPTESRSAVQRPSSNDRSGSSYDTAPPTARGAPVVQAAPLSPLRAVEQPSPLPGKAVNLSHDSAASRAAYTPPRTPEQPPVPRTPVEHFTPVDPPRRSPSKPHEVQARARDHAPLSYPPPQVTLDPDHPSSAALEVHNYSRSSSTGSSHGRPSVSSSSVAAVRPSSTSLLGGPTTTSTSTNHHNNNNNNLKSQQLPHSSSSHDTSSEGGGGTTTTARWYDDRAVQSLLNRRITPAHHYGSSSDVSRSHQTSVSSVGRGGGGGEHSLHTHSHQQRRGNHSVVPPAATTSRFDTSDDGYVSMESMQYMRQVGLL